MRLRFAAILLVVCAVASADELTIEAGFGAGWISPTQPIELKLSRPLDPAQERLAVFIDQIDLTPIVRVGGTSVTYGPGTLPLPSGQHEIVVSLTGQDGTWKEVGRFPVKVLTRRGFETATTKPSLDLANKGQVGYRQVPANSFESRDYFQDLTLQGGLATETQRGTFALRTQANLAGASYVNEALRFGELGPDAPRVDLASYRVDWQQGPALVSLGHLSFGSQRHLVQGFGGRGASLTLGMGKRASVQLAALSGTSIVGWDNILGLENTEHRMLGVTFGLELLPSRPGGARIETTWLDGSLRPFSNFNQGSIRSAEKSRGYAVQFGGSTPLQRFVVNGGYTRSRFRPARDEQLEEGVEVVPLRDSERDAAYLEATLTLLQSKQITKTQQASVSVSYRFDQVDPLFRSVASSIQADVRRDGLSLNTTIGPVSLQAAHERIEDNLDGIESILKTKTRQSTGNIGISLGSLVTGRRGAWLLPALTASHSHTHQFGASIPIDSGFNASHVPDQISRSTQAGLEWQVKFVRFGTRWNLSRQDNRQPGRELADFDASSQSIFIGVTPTERFDIGLETALDEQESLEISKKDSTRRHGLTLTWRFFRELALAGNISRTFANDDPRTSERDGHEAFAELSSGFRLWPPRAGQQQNRNRVFVRYTDRRSSSFDRIFFLSNENEGYAITTGVSMSVF